MKLNKQILEAINRGVQLALDNYEDDINLPSSKQNIVKPSDSQMMWEIYNNFVDLGLPSGTLWCKYNLGVSLTSKDPRKNLCGAFYAWGETKPRKEFTVEKYKFGDEILECGSIKYNDDDKLTQLLPEDDAVTQSFNGNTHFHIPTLEQANELLEYTNVYCIDKNNPQYPAPDQDFKIDGEYDKGWILQSTINQNYIFFPLTGIYGGIIIEDRCSAIWTSTAYIRTADHGIDGIHAFSMKFHEGWCSDTSNIIHRFGNYRFCGLQIRPVFNR